MSLAADWMYCSVWSTLMCHIHLQQHWQVDDGLYSNVASLFLSLTQQLLAQQDLAAPRTPVPTLVRGTRSSSLHRSTCHSALPVTATPQNHLQQIWAHMAVATDKGPMCAFATVAPAGVQPQRPEVQ